MGRTGKAKRFTQYLQDEGFAIHEMIADGNCMFRCISHQLSGNANKHMEYRRNIIDFIGSHRSEFIQFPDDEVEVFRTYLKRMKQDGEWGGEPELCAAARRFNVNIVVHQVDEVVLRYPAMDPNKKREIHLAYIGKSHYNSLIRCNHPDSTYINDANSCNLPAKLERDAVDCDNKNVIPEGTDYDATIVDMLQGIEINRTSTITSQTPINELIILSGGTVTMSKKVSVQRLFLCFECLF